MQAYAQYLADKMKKEKEKCVCLFCCKTAAISASFTPPATFRFQPLPAVAFLGIDVDITFHHITSQFSALASALLADLGVARSVGSHNVQQLQQAQMTQMAKPWGRQSHPITICFIYVSFKC
jgi:hypothetical protein